jgi:2-methylcitrate dehydratase PrpD
MSVAYARLCFPYLAAVALTRGTVGLDDFTPERRADPALAALAAIVTVVDDGNPDRNTMSPQRLRLLLKDGNEAEIQVPSTLGSPQRPLDNTAHLAKFRACWRHGGLGADEGERLIGILDRLEREDDIVGAIGLTAAVA